MDIKKQVTAYLKSDRTLAGGRNLYNKLPGKSLALQNTFSRMRDTPENIKKLCYQLAKLAGIPERNLNILINRPVETLKKETKKQVVKITPVLSDEEKLILGTEITDYHEGVALLKKFEVKPNSRKKEGIKEALKELREILLEKKLAEMPKEVKASIKLREQFPFLNERCPDALKLLVADMITSYNKYREAQPKLHELLSAEATKENVDLVLEKYIKNKEAWEELEHYKTNGTVLGKHPIFERLRLKDEITALDTVKLVGKIKNLKINISKNKAKENTEFVQRDEDLLLHAEDVLSKRQS